MTVRAQAAGKRDKRIRIEQPTDAQDGTYGSQTQAWTLFKERWASIKPLTGSETLNDNKIVAGMTDMFEMLYVDGLNEKMRIVYRGRIFSIMSIANPGEGNVNHEVMCAEVKLQMATLGAVQFKLEGSADLKAAFADLTDGMKRRVLARATAKAARVMVPPLRAATPKSKPGAKSRKNAERNPSGTMRKSTGLVTRKYKGGSLAMTYVGHRWPKGAAAHLVGQGTKVRTNKAGKNRGRMTPNPFMKVIFNTDRARVMAVLEEELRNGMQLEIAKAARRHAKRGE